MDDSEDKSNLISAMPSALFGCLKGSLLITKNIVEPIDTNWEVNVS